MGNIKNYNFNKLKLNLSHSDYWDFFLGNDEYTPSSIDVMTGSCFVVWYDFNNVSIYPNSATTATTIHSLVTWDDAVNTGYTLNTFGLTGIDNGYIPYIKDNLDPTNQNLVDLLTGSTLLIPSGDTRLTLNLVSGSTESFVYPTQRIIDATHGDYMQFCGGFYQGFYKLDGYSYEVLPNRVEHGWAAEFWLNPQDICSATTATTLNDTYPDNKGMFFYLGSRAENKFWNKFEGNDTGCTSGCTTSSACTGTVSTFCTVIKENEVSIIGDNGFAIPLDPPAAEFELITNTFLIYGRAYDASQPILTGNTGEFILTGTPNTIDDSCCHVGSLTGLGTKTVYNYDGNGIIIKNVDKVEPTTNPFLIYGRGAGIISGCTCGCCGPQDGLGNQTICSYTGNTVTQDEIDYNFDVIDNALGFRIKDDGSIGYRLLMMTGSCNADDTVYTSGVTIQEEYSSSGMVPSNIWSYVVIRFVTDFKEGCDLQNSKPRLGKLMFYVNGYLKFVVEEFPEFIGRRLNEYKDKQMGVPFNISLGGGSQGLLESQTFDGLDMADRGLPIEDNFAGSFIGGISQFKFNICDLPYAKIKNNYLLDKNRYL